MIRRRPVEPTPGRPTGRRARLTSRQLDALVAEATVDAYNDDEQLTGLYTLMEEHLALPFATDILGVPASVRKLDLTDDDIVAVCVAGRHRQKIPILDLPLPDSKPAGIEWIDAYRHWRKGRSG